MKKRLPFLIAAHLLALLLGVAAARVWNQNRETPQPQAAPAISASTGTSSGSRDHSRTHRPSRTSRADTTPLDSATMKDAWDIMQRQAAADRARLRPILLAEWAKVDLAAAIEATLMEPDSADLLAIFDEIFDIDANAFRPLLEGERFGLKSAELRTWWIARMAANHPDELLAMVGGFNASDQKTIITKCAEGMRGDSAKIWAMVDGFADLPDTPANRKLWSLAANAAASNENANTVVQRLSAIKGAAGDIMISEAMAVLLNRTDYAGARATYESLPADLKPQIVKAALKNPGANVSAYLAAMDEVIHTSEWTALQKPLAVKLHEMRTNPQQYPAMLEWASKLPERDDTMDIYRVAVRKFVTHQPDQARQWIAGLPNGWKQQNSLAAYVQSALFGRGDVDGAKWALQQISDPRFRAEGDGFLKHYEERTKGK